jgi:hypothetical protein
VISCIVGAALPWKSSSDRDGAPVASRPCRMCAKVAAAVSVRAPRIVASSKARMKGSAP